MIWLPTIRGVCEIILDSSQGVSNIVKDIEALSSILWWNCLQVNESLFSIIEWRNDDLHNKHVLCTDKVVSVRPPSSCMPHGLVFDGACYYMEQKDRSTWKDALLKCRKFGMELVSIHSVTELEVIREYIVRSEEEQVWIGMTNSRKESDLFKSGEFHFIWEHLLHLVIMFWIFLSYCLLAFHEEQNINKFYKNGNVLSYLFFI